MAVDPLTGQTRFDQAYAGYLDPNALAQIAAGQSQSGMLGSLGQQMIQSNYIPNSGFGGALAQMVQALVGSKMLKDSQSQVAELTQKQIEAMNEAAQKKHAQEIADKEAESKRAIAQALGIKEGETKIGLQYAPQESEAAAAKAAATALATEPIDVQKAVDIARGTLPLDIQKTFATAGAAEQAKVAMARKAGASDDDIRQMLVGKNENLPSGYRKTADGNLEFVPGGPADPSVSRKAQPLTAEARTKLSLIDNALANAQKYASRTVGENGNFNDVASRTNDTPQLMKSAIQDMLYAKSGASAPQAEVDKAMAMYAPSLMFGIPTERDSTASAKVQNFITDMKRMREEIAGGVPAAEKQVLPNSPTAPAAPGVPSAQDILAELQRRKAAGLIP